jgi:hypothetical protein
LKLEKHMGKNSPGKKMPKSNSGSLSLMRNSKSRSFLAPMSQTIENLITEIDGDGDEDDGDGGNEKS